MMVFLLVLASLQVRVPPQYLDVYPGLLPACLPLSPVHCGHGGAARRDGAAALHPVVAAAVDLDRVLLAPGVPGVGPVVGGWPADLRDAGAESAAVLSLP